MDRPTEDSTATDPGWVDEIFLTGRSTDVCLRLPEPVDRGTLRRLVGEAQARLAAAGLRPGGA
ncbi:long-chain fatty acid--CoA ligase, partial [Micromonospora purpureochromogenes]